MFIKMDIFYYETDIRFSSMGFSSMRSGGLTKYAEDLMHAQSKLGHEVVALYPSGISIFHKECHAKKRQFKLRDKKLF